MANNNTLIPSILVAVLACFFVGVSLAEGDGAAALEAAAGGGGESMSCLEKLEPCQAFLTDHSKKPSPECCTPLSDVFTKETACLCALFQNDLLLQTVNITQDNALTVAKECDIKADPSICKSAHSPSASHSHAEESHSPDSNNSSSTKSEASDAMNVKSPFGAYLGVLSFLGLMM